MTCGCSEGMLGGGFTSEKTKAEWYELAKKHNVKGRSKMTKNELKKACVACIKKRSSKK